MPGRRRWAAGAGPLGRRRSAGRRRWRHGRRPCATGWSNCAVRRRSVRWTARVRAPAGLQRATEPRDGPIRTVTAQVSHGMRSRARTGRTLRGLACRTGHPPRGSPVGPGDATAWITCSTRSTASTRRASIGTCTRSRAARPAPSPSRRTVVIPVRAFEGAKSRLGAVLDAEERRDLVERLLRRTVAAALATPGVAEVARRLAGPRGPRAGRGGRRPARRPSGPAASTPRSRRRATPRPRADRLLVLPARPARRLAPRTWPRSSRPATRAGHARGVVLAPDRHGRGTNALLLDPPDVIDPAFGGDSRAGPRVARRRPPTRRSSRCRVSSRWTWTRPTTCCWPRPQVRRRRIRVG